MNTERMANQLERIHDYIPEHIADLPAGGGHWTRDVQFSSDGKTMFVSVGSRSNADDPDTHPEEKHRADILAFNPDGSGMRVYASGIRNAVGIAVSPKTGELWCSVNERDGLGKQFPAEYRGDIFAAEHGSWNKAIRVGYEVIRVPLDQSGHAKGEYQDFLTGFVLPNGNVWGRPVGVTVAQDGSLLVSDDGSNSIWRVSYTGK